MRWPTVTTKWQFIVVMGVILPGLVVYRLVANGVVGLWAEVRGWPKTLTAVWRNLP